MPVARSRILLGVVLVSLAAAVGYLGVRWRAASPPHHGPAVTLLPDSTGLESHRAPTSDVAGPAEPLTFDSSKGSSKGHLSSPITRRSIEEWVALAGKRELLPSMVPRFDADTEAELIRRYGAAAAPEEKKSVAKVMAFGGGSAAVERLTNALLHEFAGRMADPDNQDLAGALSRYLGILARREDSALQFLLAAAEGRIDLRRAGLVSGDGGGSDRLVLGSFWNGLGWSGRPEAKEFLEEVLDGAHRPATTNREAAVVGAAFRHKIVSSRGVDEMMRLSNDPDDLLREFGVWKRGTEDGRAWDAWFHEHSPLVNPAYRKSRSKAE